MRKHGRHPDTERAAARWVELALDHLRHVALLQHDRDEMRLLRHRPAVDIDELRRGGLRRCHLDGILVHGRAGVANLIDEGQQGTAEADHFVEPHPGQNGGARGEKRLGCRVRADDPVRLPRERGSGAARAARRRSNSTRLCRGIGSSATRLLLLMPATSMIVMLQHRRPPP